MTDNELIIRESLPALVARAAGRLAEAKSSAEVLEAKRVAESALHYAKLTKAANETHADCLRIITRAELRMADEIDHAQQRGELARNGQHGEAVQTSDSLDLDRRRVAEWRELRNAGGEDVVEQAIDQALSEGRAPTKTDITRHVRGTFGTGNNEWFTPSVYIDAAREVMGGIDLDPASHPIAQETVKAARFYTLDDDGLTKDWIGRTWLNPPYSQPLIGRFIAKLEDQWDARPNGGGVSEFILLTHNYSDTAWFQTAASLADLICFPRGRIRFVDPTGDTCSPTQGQAFFYGGPNATRFANVFGAFGFVTKPITS